jgi:hypothetical protein
MDSHMIAIDGDHSVQSNTSNVGSMQMAADYVLYLQGLSTKELAAVVERRVADARDVLVDDDAVATRLAQSNSTMWGCDEFDISDVQLSGVECRAKVRFHASGEPDADRMYCGSELYGSATVVIDNWGHVGFEDVVVMSVK